MTPGKMGTFRDLMTCKTNDPADRLKLFLVFGKRKPRSGIWAPSVDILEKKGTK